MDGSQFRCITRREYRAKKCACPDCGYFVYVCPFGINYQLGSLTPGVHFACDPPVTKHQEAKEAFVKDYELVTGCYQQEYFNSVSSNNAGISIAKDAMLLWTRYATWFASSKICRATQRAVAAWAHVYQKPSDAVSTAKAALAMSPGCPEALFLLALLEAKSYEEALELCNKACDNYNQLLSESGWVKCRAAFPYVALAPPLHSFARCMVGAIHALCRLRRGAEAYDKMQVLLRLIPRVHDAPLEDIWGIAPEVVYRAKGPAACLEWLSTFMCDEVLHQGGAGVWWLATWALAWVATHPDEDFKWSSLVPYEDETVIMGKDGGNGSSSSGAPERKCSYKQYLARVRLKSPRGVKEKLQNGMALATCCCWMPHLVDMLLGDIPIPSGPLPPLSMSPGAMAPQVAYARYCEDLWRDTPGVLDYVRRYRNTYEVFCITTDTRTDRKANMDEFRRYMAPFSELAPKPAAPVTAASASSAGFGSRSRSGSRSLSHTGIFPDAIMYQEYGGWHGFVEIACASTSFNATRQDATMEAAELEILQTLLAAGCPIDAGRVMGPRGVPGPYISPFFTAMHLGYGPEAVRHLVRAGADPLAMDLCDEVPLLSAAERGMWRELQAVFKARRKLGSMVPPPYIGCYFMTRLHSRGVTAYPPVTVFQLLLQAAVASSYLPGGAGRGRGPGDCNEDEQKEAALVIPPSPWCSYFKVIEVLVAYGMTSVPEPLMSALDKIPDRLAPEPQRSVKAVLQHLRTLLKEKAEERGVEQEGEQSKAQRQEQQRKGSLQEHGQKGEVADQKVQPQQQIASPVSLSSTHAVCCVQGERQGQQQQNEKREAGSQNKPQEKKKQQQTQKEQQRRNSEQRNEATNSDLNEVSEHAKPKLPPTQHQQQQRTTQILACSGASSAGPTSQGQGRDNSAGTDHSALSAVGDEVIAAGLVSAVTPSNDCRHCWACGKENDRAAGVKMRKCSMCCTARYCGGQCQKVHWPLHRQECKVLAAAAVKEKKKSVQQEEAEKEKKTSEVKGRAAGRGS